MLAWLLYLALGAFVGLLAGLLGVGGGIVVVPMLTFIFTFQHLPAEHILHLAIGTSLASIIFTSVSSLRAHHVRGAVEWQVLRRITMGIILGTLAGSWVAAHLSSRFLKGFFVCFIFYVALRMLINIKHKPHRQLADAGGMFAAGSLIGGISSLVGIGGGSMTVPFLVWCNVPLHTAIGTSAAIGFPIAVAGAVGYVANGLAVSTLPPWSLGFVYLPSLVGISLASILTAPLGARLSHNLPVVRLRNIFAIFLIVIGLKMLADFI
ncbi:MAG: sulfite exporter TauE/SafE family protein [Geobacteraceae bacterium]